MCKCRNAGEKLVRHRHFYRQSTSSVRHRYSGIWVSPVRYRWSRISPALLSCANIYKLHSSLIITDFYLWPKSTSAPINHKWTQIASQGRWPTPEIIQLIQIGTKAMVSFQAFRWIFAAFLLFSADQLRLLCSRGGNR
jgi:hypothetical protein